MPIAHYTSPPEDFSGCSFKLPRHRSSVVNEACHACIDPAINDGGGTSGGCFDCGTGVQFPKWYNVFWPGFAEPDPLETECITGNLPDDLLVRAGWDFGIKFIWLPVMPYPLPLFGGCRWTYSLTYRGDVNLNPRAEDICDCVSITESFLVPGPIGSFNTGPRDFSFELIRGEIIRFLPTSLSIRHFPVAITAARPPDWKTSTSWTLSASVDSGGPSNAGLYGPDAQAVARGMTRVFSRNLTVDCSGPTITGDDVRIEPRETRDDA